MHVGRRPAIYPNPKCYSRNRWPSSRAGYFRRGSHSYKDQGDVSSFSVLGVGRGGGLPVGFIFRGGGGLIQKDCLFEKVAYYIFLEKIYKHVQIQI